MDNLSSEVARALSTDIPSGPLGKARRKRKAAEVASTPNPKDELRRLVLEHKALVDKAKAFEASVSDRKSRTTGEVLKSRIPEDRRIEVMNVVDSFRDAAKDVEAKMTKELRQIQLYKLFLSKVFGCGPVVAAYLIALIDFNVCIKYSQLSRFCGIAAVNGKLEKKTRGQKIGYVDELRTRLWQMMTFAWMNAAKSSAGAPNGKTSKYLRVWTDYKHRMEHSPRYDRATNTIKCIDADGKEYIRNGARDFIHKTGRLKATDVFLYDLYMIGRAIEGLDVWPTYEGVYLGYEHGARAVENRPLGMTLEQLLEMVVDPGGIPLPTS